MSVNAPHGFHLAPLRMRSRSLTSSQPDARFDPPFKEIEMYVNDNRFMPTHSAGGAISKRVVDVEQAPVTYPGTGEHK